MKRHETLPGQLLAFDEHSGMARALLLHLINHEWDAICAGARRRLREGYPVYGHETWEKGEDGLWKELFEELEDGLNYAVMTYEKRGGEYAHPYHLVRPGPDNALLGADRRCGEHPVS